MPYNSAINSRSSASGSRSPYFVAIASALSRYAKARDDSPRSEYASRFHPEGVNPAWDSLDADRRTDLARRMAIFAAMVDRMDQNIGRVLTQEQGKPLPEAKAEILHSADTFEWFGEEGKRAYGQLIPNSAPGKRHLTMKHPVGVVGAISPWNFPITLQSRKIAPALAVG